MKYLNVQVPVTIFKEAGSFMVFSPVLDVTGVGRTQKQAERRFQEAVGIFFEEVIERGTLTEALQGLGWQRIKKNWAPPKVSYKIDAIQVPLSV